MIELDLMRAARRRPRALPGFALAILLCGCAQMPAGPLVTVMPGPHKPFDEFMQDDAQCRGWAAHSVGIPGNEAAAEAFIGSTAVGATIGVLAGAAAGRHGAGGGAATGTVIGAMVGSERGADAAWSAQRRYDIAYQQCMYAKGNQVPGVMPPGAGAAWPPPPPPPRAR